MKIINFFNKFRATFLFKKLNLAVPKNYNTNNKNKGDISSFVTHPEILV